MAFRASSRLISRFRWSTICVTSIYTYNAIVVEPETNTKFNDELMIMVYPGLKKEFPHWLTKLATPIVEPSLSFRYFKQRFMTKQFVMGAYESNTVKLYRMVLLDDYTGGQLMDLIKPPMINQSQLKYNTEVDMTRTGSLFFAAIAKLKLNKDDEIVFLCNSETNNFTVWVDTNEKFYMHFTIESTLLNDCVNYAFGSDKSPIFNTTYSVKES